MEERSLKDALLVRILRDNPKHEYREGQESAGREARSREVSDEELEDFLRMEGHENCQTSFPREEVDYLMAEMWIDFDLLQ